MLNNFKFHFLNFLKNFKNNFFVKNLFNKIVYPNNLKYSKLDTKSISENRLLLSVVEKVIEKIKSKKSENFVLNRYNCSQNVYKPKLILKSNKGR